MRNVVKGFFPRNLFPLALAPLANADKRALRTLRLALKGFAGAMLGGMGNPKGALVGGFAIGMIEALTAGYLSSQYKDAAAFVVILAVLFFLPQGLFGRTSTDRV